MEALRALLLRSALGLTLLVLAGLALLGAAVLMILALHLYLATLVSPATAALLTGCVILLLAGLLLVVARSLFLVRRVHRGTGEAADNARLIGLLRDWVKERPRESIVTGLVAGLCLGASPDLRGLLLSLLRERKEPPGREG